MTNYPVRCIICNDEFDSQDSVADSMAMLRDHTKVKHVFELRDWESLESLVFTAVGAASACWENLSGAGIFESTRAEQIGQELVILLLKKFGASPTPGEGTPEDGERQNIVGRSWLR